MGALRLPQAVLAGGAHMQSLAVRERHERVDPAVQHHCQEARARGRAAAKQANEQERPNELAAACARMRASGVCGAAEEQQLGLGRPRHESACVC